MRRVSPVDGQQGLRLKNVDKKSWITLKRVTKPELHLPSRQDIIWLEWISNPVRYLESKPLVTSLAVVRSHRLVKSTELKKIDWLVDTRIPNPAPIAVKKVRHVPNVQRNFDFLSRDRWDLLRNPHIHRMGSGLART